MKKNDGNDMIQNKETMTMKQRLHDLLVAVSWANISRVYFASWLYHKMDGRDGNGKPTSFTPEEAEVKKSTLINLSERIRKAANTIEVLSPYLFMRDISMRLSDFVFRQS